MRILLTTYADRSLFQYLVPLAWALRTAGHEVRVAAQPDFADVITQSGLTAQPVGSNRDPWRIAGLDQGRLEAERGGLPEPYDVVDHPDKLTWDYLVQGYAGKVKGWLRQVSFPLIADLVELSRQWQPDLILWEPNCYAGPIAAKACGAANARILYGADVFGVTRDHYLRLAAERPGSAGPDPLAEWLSGYARKYGFTYGEEMINGDFTIDQFPASLQLPADLTYLRTRYVPYGGPSVVPKWLWEAPRRPRIALTLGITAHYRFGGYHVDVQEILDGLADLDVEVVATVAQSQQQHLTRVGDNTRVESFVPLDALAPTCAAVIHHAGAATLATVSLHGVPQLALPLHFDQPVLARKLAAQGAGLHIPAAEATGAAVSEAVQRLLSESSFADRATALADEMAATPSPNDVVTQIEQLTAKNR